MNEQFIKEFRTTLNEAEKKLLRLTDSDSTTPRAPGKWTPREIIGHLIDSASNNHQRFIRAQLKEDLMFEGYDQEQWVIVQQYNREEWHQLVGLWKNFNLHLLHAIEQIPEEVLMKKRSNHNLHQLAWKPVPEHEPVTLEYFIRDYLGNLQHHLKQIITPL